MQQRYDDQLSLQRQGYGARLRLLQQQQAYVTAQQDLAAQRARLDEASAQVSSLDRDMAQAREEFVAQAAQERAEAEGVVATRGDAVRKADQRQSLQKLTAPVSGIVQEVSVTTIGEVPAAGKPLVTIVPDGEALVVEALMMNRDAGIASHRGDRAIVKLEAYPFTRYGTLEGTVEHVSPDATVDQQRGLVFPVRVRLTRTKLTVDGRPAALSPGMAATAEVVTGQRRVSTTCGRPWPRRCGKRGGRGEIGHQYACRLDCRRRASSVTIIHSVGANFDSKDAWSQV